VVFVLVADSLAVRYRNGALGIEDVSLNVEAGELVAIYGPNGSGKTTAVRALGGFLRTESTRVIRGKVLFNGKDITNSEPHRIHRLGLALVPERNKIFTNLTVAENFVSLGHLPARAERAARLERVYEMFPVLADRRSTLAGKLSGGQQQMLAIGRALIPNVSLLIVDEVTLGLHPSLHRPLYSAIRDIARDGRAAIVVDEDLNPAAEEFADRYYRLEAGTVVKQGAATDG
jgi:branched-chain amino acid transport system ATP-binding protein